MRTYHQIPLESDSHESIFKEMFTFLAGCTVPRDIDNSKAYLESCYLSKKMFDRLSCDAKRLSENEFFWMPTTKRAVYQMICSLEPMPDTNYYKVKLIADGASVFHFAGVSGMSYFFMDADEEGTYQDD